MRHGKRALWPSIFVLLAALPAAAAGTPPAGVAGRSQLLVLDIQADVALDKELRRTLNEILLNAFYEGGALDVLGSSDIAAMLTLQEERIKIAGCADESCMAEIGGALGVKHVAAMRVGTLGEQYVVSLKLLDVARARVLSRASRSVARQEAALGPAIRTVVAEVLERAGLARAGRALQGGGPAGASGGGAAGGASGAGGAVPDPGSGAATSTAAPAPEQATGFLDVAPWIGLGLTLAAGGAAGVLGGLALNEESAARKEYAGSPPWQDHHDAMKSRAVAADALIGVAGAAAVTTLVLFLVGPGDDAGQGEAGQGAGAGQAGRGRAGGVGVAVAPAPGGVAAVLSVRFE